MSTTDIYNYRRVNERLVTAGQPTPEQLKSAAEDGFRTVINLATRKSDNALADEAGLVQELGLVYHHIPVEWDNPTVSDWAAFEQALRAAPGKTLVHCAANFRATAFYGLYALKNLGWSEAQFETFRGSIWQGSDYPIWEKFIGEMKVKIQAMGLVQLRDVVETDLPIFYEQQLDPEATQMAAFPARDRATFMTHWAKILADKNNQIQAILFNGQVAGNLVSFELEGHREVGYWLGREFWGRGIATRALTAFLSQIAFRPLYGYTAKHNRASQRVLEKCGFWLDGETDHEFIFKLG
jgi:uncharacterized protein (TIGR01244 family)